MSAATGSDGLFQRACAVIPGGVNSPVRAFGAVGGTPVFMASGHGPYLNDRRFQIVVDNCRAFAAGRELRNVVDKSSWF